VDEFVASHMRFVWRLARHLGLDEADADDVAQCVLLTAVRRFDDIQPGREKAFLYRTTCHMAHKAHRSKNRRCEDITDDLSDHVAAGPGAEELLEERRAQDELCRILKRLPEKFRTVFVLFELEGWSQLEISRNLGLAQGTVASRIRRARQRFERLATNPASSRGGETR
jgi:RNA polymerase sigma-70 factor (ECF subfamily)